MLFRFVPLKERGGFIIMGTITINRKKSIMGSIEWYCAVNLTKEDFEARAFKAKGSVLKALVNVKDYGFDPTGMPPDASVTIIKNGATVEIPIGTGTNTMFIATKPESKFIYSDITEVQDGRTYFPKIKAVGLNSSKFIID